MDKVKIGRVLISIVSISILSLSLIGCNTSTESFDENKENIAFENNSNLTQAAEKIELVKNNPTTNLETLNELFETEATLEDNITSREVLIYNWIFDDGSNIKLQTTENETNKGIVSLGSGFYKDTSTTNKLDEESIIYLKGIAEKSDNSNKTIKFLEVKDKLGMPITDNIVIEDNHIISMQYKYNDGVKEIRFFVLQNNSTETSSEQVEVSFIN